MKIGVLLSVGRHPSSRRERASHADLAALRLALASGQPVTGLHAGPAREVLRDYGAYGLTELMCFENAAEDKAAVRAITGQVHAGGIGMLVAGSLGEAPWATGLLPYRVAHALGWPVWPCGIALSYEAGRWQAISRLDAQARRRHATAAGAVLLAAPQGIDHMVYAAQRRERMVLRDGNGTVQMRMHAVTAAVPADPAAPTMPQPAWTRPDPRDSAAARLATLRGVRADTSGRIVHGLTPAEAAGQVLEFLQRHGLTVPKHDEGRRQ